MARSRVRGAGFLGAMLAALALAAAPAAAQEAATETAAVTLAPPVTLIYLADLSSEDAGERIRDILLTRVTERLVASGLAPLDRPVVGAAAVAPPGGVQIPLSVDDVRIGTLVSLDVPEDVEMVLACFYRVSGSEMLIQFTLYNPREETVLGGVLTRARTGLTVFTSVDRSVAELEEPLARYLKLRAEYKPPVGVVEKISVSSPLEDMGISFAGRDVGRISGGHLDVPYTPFPVGSQVRIELSKPGYHPEERVVALESEENQLELQPLWPQSRIGVELQWTLGQALGFGAGFRLYVVPDNTFVHLQVYRHLQPAQIAGNAVRHYDAALSIGQYLLLPYSFPVRFSLELGLGVIVNAVNAYDGPSFADLYLYLLSPSVELNLKGWSFLARPEMKYALGLPGNLLGRVWLRTPLGLPPVTLAVVRRW